MMLQAGFGEKMRGKLAGKQLTLLFSHGRKKECQILYPSWNDCAC